MGYFDNYKFRCHSFGNLTAGIPKPLTNNQLETYKSYTDRKNGNGKPLTDNQLITWADLKKKSNSKCTLTDGAKKFLSKLALEEIVNRRKNIYGLYLDKGNRVEEKSITMYSNITGKLFLKNKETKEDEYIKGTPDNVQGKIRDIKSSYEYDTFPYFDKTIKNTMYKWQLDCYMRLWKFKEAELIYCLVDTPFDIIDDELRRLEWRFRYLDSMGNVNDNSIPLLVETVQNHIYTEESLYDYCMQSSIVQFDWFDNFVHIEEKDRIKVFHHKFDETRNKYIEEICILSRNYMNEIYEDYISTKKINNKQ